MAHKFEQVIESLTYHKDVNRASVWRFFGEIRKRRLCPHDALVQLLHER